MKAYQTPELLRLQFSFLIVPRCPGKLHQTKSALEAHFLQFYISSAEKQAQRQTTANKSAGGRITRENEGGDEDIVAR